MMTEGTMTLGELLRAKLDGVKPDETTPGEIKFVFPDQDPTPQHLQANDCVIGRVQAILTFRIATGVPLSNTSWSYDASFHGQRYISLNDLARWIRAYYTSASL
jgi:hypothetical protein